MSTQIKPVDISLDDTISGHIHGNVLSNIANAKVIGICKGSNLVNKNEAIANFANIIPALNLSNLTAVPSKPTLSLEDFDNLTFLQLKEGNIYREIALIWLMPNSVFKSDVRTTLLTFTGISDIDLDYLKAILNSSELANSYTISFI